MLWDHVSFSKLQNLSRNCDHNRKPNARSQPERQQTLSLQIRPCHLSPLLWLSRNIMRILLFWIVLVTLWRNLPGKKTFRSSPRIPRPCHCHPVQHGSFSSLQPDLGTWALTVAVGTPSSALFQLGHHVLLESITTITTCTTSPHLWFWQTPVPTCSNCSLALQRSSLSPVFTQHWGWDGKQGLTVRCLPHGEEIRSTIAMPEIVKGNFCLKGFFKHIQNMIENEQAKGLEVGAFILSASPTQAWPCARRP